MADRTSAEIFGRIFGLLAADPTAENKRLARQIFEISKDYDFTPNQMYADEASLILGLAREGVSQISPQDGLMLRFLGEDGFEEISP